MTPNDHPDTALAPDDTFVVYHRARAWIVFAVLSVLSVVSTLVMAIAFWRVDPAVLTEGGVQMVLLVFVMLAAGLAFAARKMARSKRIILSADALGVWAGMWGKRQRWDDIATIRIRAAPGDVISPQKKFLAFEPQLSHPKALGRKIEASLNGRMVDLRAMKSDRDTVITGLIQAAKAAGYVMRPDDSAKPDVWVVEKALNTAPDS